MAPHYYWKRTNFSTGLTRLYLSQNECKPPSFFSCCFSLEHAYLGKLNRFQFLKISVQLSLLICRFYICKSTYRLPFICNPKASTHRACPFYVTFFTFLCFFLVTAFQNDLQVLSSVPMFKKTMMCFMEKICMLDKLQA